MDLQIGKLYWLKNHYRRNETKLLLVIDIVEDESAVYLLNMATHEKHRMHLSWLECGYTLSTT